MSITNKMSTASHPLAEAVVDPIALVLSSDVVMDVDVLPVDSAGGSVVVVGGASVVCAVELVGDSVIAVPAEVGPEPDVSSVVDASVPLCVGTFGPHANAMVAEATESAARQCMVLIVLALRRVCMIVSSKYTTSKIELELRDRR